MHVLLIEDDLDLGPALQKSLKLEGISSVWRRRAEDAERTLAGEGFDCVLLDLSLPDGDGLDLLTRWRRQSAQVPIIIITARGTLPDRLAGLDSGADDFIVKPFALEELASRLRAVVRRSARQASDVWAIGDLEIEPRGHCARLRAEALDLSPREFQLLLELAREPNAVVVKGTLAQRLEPLGEPLDFSLIEVHVSNLRRKVGAERIKTVRGVGYMLVP
ncbi:response regulator [Variovorax sp. ZT4R33]|uniref:response regulator n=1 Tax=Variovorax sp. ZT4R33 TaxID=3443743 RepID=UPI003F470294